MSLRTPAEVPVTVAIESADPGTATVSPSSLTFTPSDWSVAQPVTVTGGEDDDYDDDPVRISHAARGGAYDGVTGEVVVTVTDRHMPPGQVAGVTLTPGTHRLAVAWDAVDGADGYRVQWKSEDESFEDALAAGREAVLEGGAVTDWTVTELSARKAWDVRVVAVRDGQPDGVPSATVRATPRLLTIQTRRTYADGTDVDSRDHVAYGVLYLAVRFDGVSAAAIAAVAKEDLEVAGGTIRERRIDGSEIRLVIDIGDGVSFTLPGRERPEEGRYVRVTYRKDLISLGNRKQTSNWRIGRRLTPTLSSTATEPVTGSFAVTVGFSEAVSQGVDGTDPAPQVFATGDIEVTNGTVSGLVRETDARYVATIVPAAGIEGAVVVTVPEGVIVAGADEFNRNAAASGEWRADTLTDDATLASFAVVETADTANAFAPDPPFDPKVLSYLVRVPNRVGKVTVTALVRDRAPAKAVITPPDADTGTEGHQVALEPDSNRVTLTVTAEDGSATMDYEVDVFRDPAPALDISGLTEPKQNGGDLDAVPEGGTAWYAVALASRPSAPVTVTVESGDEAVATVSPASLAFTPETWDEPRTVTLEAKHDSDGEDGTVELTHRAAGGDYEGVTRSVDFAVGDDDEPPAQVTGLRLTPGGLELGVAWNEVPRSDGYRVQWKSVGEGFDDAAADGREAVLELATSTAYTITGLSARAEYTVRVIATLSGQPDGAPSQEKRANPLRTTPRARSIDEDGNTVEYGADYPAYTVLRIAVAFPGVADAELAEIAADDLRPTGGTVRELEVVDSELVIVIDIDEGVSSVQVRIPRDVVAPGNTLAQVVVTAGIGVATLLSSPDVVEPVTGSFDVRITFFSAVQQGTAGTDPPSQVFSSDDVLVERGSLSALKLVGTRGTVYVATIVPEADFEGILTVTVPAGAVVADGDLRRPSLEASGEWRVDTLDDDATLASLAVVETADRTSAVALDPAFDPARSDYVAAVPHRVDSVTVAAVVRDRSPAKVGIDPGDADPHTPGHQVALEVGVNTVTMTVTAEDGTTTRAYTVVIERREAPGLRLPAAVEVAEGGP